MLTLRFTSCYVVVVEFVVAPVKLPFFMRDSCHRWFFRIFFVAFLFLLCVWYFVFWAQWSASTLSGPMINDRFLFYFLLFCTDFN